MQFVGRMVRNGRSTRERTSTGTRAGGGKISCLAEVSFRKMEFAMLEGREREGQVSRGDSHPYCQWVSYLLSVIPYLVLQLTPKFGLN